MRYGLICSLCIITCMFCLPLFIARLRYSCVVSYWSSVSLTHLIVILECICNHFMMQQHYHIIYRKLNYDFSNARYLYLRLANRSGVYWAAIPGTTRVSRVVPSTRLGHDPNRDCPTLGTAWPTRGEPCHVTGRARPVLFFIFEKYPLRVVVGIIKSIGKNTKNKLRVTVRVLSPLFDLCMIYKEIYTIIISI